MKNIDHIIQDSTFTEKVMIGLNKALRKLAESSAANNENLIVGDKDGNVKSVPAKELLKTLSK
ncbi:hypothetical protein CPT03_01570 [Pedobacter ginsengisoli]|jgi:hypothetical protein|uniref:Uncharacterized protein n=1 Tax=Pedobacter ginsengisoli TaxID=363852 RepID=A0A2D1U0U0_9SPHI|nr:MULTISPECIES: hypothetical protein [Pedobacter]ATP55242.1 hypothetical protein CPT03_01570 [Pedobacter ginsengisoli]NQX52654.1 hypothetical protein [Pedobacter panaciterrae]